MSKSEKDNETKTERESDKFEERERGRERADYKNHGQRRDAQLVIYNLDYLKKIVCVWLGGGGEVEVRLDTAYHTQKRVVRLIDLAPR